MARLDVDVGIRNAAFRRGLDEMRNGVNRFKADVGKMFVGAIGFSAIAAGIKSVVQYADQLSDLGQKFGVSTGSLQAFKNVLDENGASLEVFAGAMNKLEVARSKALQGDDRLRASFAALGVTVEDLKSLSPDQLMLKIGSSSMDAAQMVEVLGKSSLDLRVALKSASLEGIDFSNTMSNYVVSSLATANDQFNRFANDLRNHLGTAIVWIKDQFLDATASVVAGAAKIVAAGKFIGEGLSKGLTGDVAGVKAAWEQYRQEIAKTTRNLDTFRLAEKMYKDGKNAEAPSGGFHEGDSSGGSGSELEKREDRLQKIRDAEADAAREALEGQAKINALIEERNRLLEVYKNSSDEDDAGLDALEKAQQIQRKIESEEKKEGEAKKRRQDEIATKKAEEAEAEVAREEKIAAARKDEFEAREDDVISTLKGNDKIKALDTKRQRMQGEADLLEESDPEAAARKRAEIIGVQASIRDEKNAMAEADKVSDPDKKLRPASVPTDSLGAVGGGRGKFGGSDPILQANKEQVNLLREINAKLGSANEKGMRREANLWP